MKCKVQNHTEVPIIFGVRQYGYSKLSSKIIVHYLQHLRFVYLIFFFYSLKSLIYFLLYHFYYRSLDSIIFFFLFLTQNCRHLYWYSHPFLVIFFIIFAIVCLYALVNFLIHL